MIITARGSVSNQRALALICTIRWAKREGIRWDCLLAAVPRVQIHMILRPGLFSLHLVTIAAWSAVGARRTSGGLRSALGL